MGRRIMMMGLGAIAGVVVWYVVMVSLGWWPGFLEAMQHSGSRSAGRSLRFYLASAAALGVGGGMAAAYLGEKLRLVPSDEEVASKEKPVSLFDRE